MRMKKKKKGVIKRVMKRKKKVRVNSTARATSFRSAIEPSPAAA